jgi:3-deoxy-D-manno-octulosonic-acid transferase
MGELSLWYSASATTFVAGSILPIGGHTPFEPAAYGSAIIHGPHFSNFQDIYKELDQGQGAFLTESADEISTAWENLRTENLRTETLLHAKSILFGHAQKDQCINEIMRNIATLIST